MQPRSCAHCHTEFWAAHKRRLYCTNSCNTQAYNRRKALAGLASTPPSLPVAAATQFPASTSVPVLAPAPKQTLDWNLSNLALLSTAAALGQLGVYLGTALWELFTTRSPPLPVEIAQRPDPLSWLPAGLLTSAARRVRLDLPHGADALVFVELPYLGHVLYYQPRERVLLWGALPGTYLALLTAEHVDGVAEQQPYQPPRAALPAPAADAPWEKPGQQAYLSASTPSPALEWGTLPHRPPNQPQERG